MNKSVFLQGTSLDYALYDFDQKGYAKVPPPSLNGGLYTGEPFAKDAPYGNFPVTPTTDVFINHGIRSANPPPGATTQYPHQVRLGNNPQTMPGVGYYDPETHFVQCTPGQECTPKNAPCWMWGNGPSDNGYAAWRA